jgi:hypothetical protein
MFLGRVDYQGKWCLGLWILGVYRPLQLQCLKDLTLQLQQSSLSDMGSAPSSFGYSQRLGPKPCDLLALLSKSVKVPRKTRRVLSEFKRDSRKLSAVIVPCSQAFDDCVPYFEAFDDCLPY